VEDAVNIPSLGVTVVTSLGLVVDGQYVECIGPDWEGFFGKDTAVRRSKKQAGSRTVQHTKDSSF